VVKSHGRERYGKGIDKMSGMRQGRRTQVNRRKRVDSAKVKSKPGSFRAREEYSVMSMA